MIARAVVIKVNPGCEVELTRTFEQEVIPRFRKERDFRGLLAFTVPDGTEALSLSLWDQKETSRGFFTRSFAALAALARVALGKPSVQVVRGREFPITHPGASNRPPGKASRRRLILGSISRLFGLSKWRPRGPPRARGFPLIWCLINSFHM